MSEIFKALADPTRRRVLQMLRERPMTAGELADGFAYSKATMSAHFAVLREAGLVTTSKKGATITYALSLSVLEDALLAFAQTVGLGVVRSNESPPEGAAPKGATMEEGKG